MCEISEAVKLKDNKRVIISCTSYDEEFMRAKVVHIHDKSGNRFTSKDFIMDNPIACFSADLHRQLWIGLQSDISANFLEKGNKIFFEY